VFETPRPRELEISAFLARDSIYATTRYMLSPVRPSFCPFKDGWSYDHATFTTE